ncbi:MAG: lipoprotein-releasing ABC transporter permease subunit [Gammaproteobacteria bacterium]|jgi:lipoprotein-releasing system permease protein|nr:lipoprotein-releasing ABC transporter permease subunit [Gammaproteobacteria bacterium]
MMRPVALFVGLRYLQTQRSNGFASFVSIASVIGVALGVAALIVVLSVMNGFENELRVRLLSLAGHASISPQKTPLPWREMRRALVTNPGIEAAAPFVELEAMLANGRNLSGALLTGVEPGFEQDISAVGRHMRSGALADLQPGQNTIILGRALALKLGVYLGDSLTVMVPRKQAAGIGLDTSLRRFRIVGIFELGLRDHDGVRALVHLDNARIMAGLDKPTVGLRIKTSDIFSAPQIVRSWVRDWTPGSGIEVAVRDWTQDNATYFRAVRIEKIMMTLLLSLIVGVALFNIVATLVMVVMDKRSGIAILRTLGYSRRTIVQIFAVQGIVVGWVGVIIGVAIGIVMTKNVDQLAPRLEQLFGFQFMPADVYYLTSLSADLHTSDVVWISVIALLMTALATIYPALRAAGIAPAEVLRYE